MNTNIRVLYIADYEGRGLDSRLTRCALKLASACDLVIGTWGGEVEPGLLAEVAESGVPARYFQFKFHPRQRPVEVTMSIREFRRVLDDERIDVVHCQCYRHLVLCRLASALSRRRPALVFTDHNSDGRKGIRVLSRIGVLAAIRPQIIDMDGFLLRVPFLRKKATWISNPVDTSVFHPVERPRQFSDPVSLVFPARLTGAKGHDVLLIVCSRLRQSGLRFRLVLAGDGPARQNLQDLAISLGIQKNVHFAGQLNREELLRELWSADIGVFPSPREMLPCAVLEMMATGLPVVAFAAGGIPRIIRHGHTGFVAPVGASGDFEQYLSALMVNPSLARKIGLQAATEARVRFDIAVVTREIAQLYRNLAPANGVGAGNAPVEVRN